MSLSNILFPMLPKELESLAELALDVRWSWNHKADALWKQLNPELWELTRNPKLILQDLSRSELQSLSNNKVFSDTLNSILKDQRDSLHTMSWFENAHSHSSLTKVAYFSMEFGLSESLPFYSGGLGLLAGDHLKSASDLGVPLVGVGLLYQEGYFRQAINAEGEQIALYPSNNPYEMQITPVLSSEGRRLRIKITVNDHSIWIRAWQAQIGMITLYLLDINDPANAPADRCITSHLYGGGPEQRIQQEILLGIGGWRLLEELNIKPEVCHLNEGHPALAILERARSLMEQSGLGFEEALTITRAGNIFTTHTPVPAGFDCFPPGLMEQTLSHYAQMLGISFAEFMALGRIHPKDNDEPFNMAYLAIRGSNIVNGVSQLHGKISRRIFAPLFPGWPASEIPVGHITNGVHVPSWDSKEADEFWTITCGQNRWICEPDDICERIRSVSDDDLWSFRCLSREKLIAYTRKRLSRRTAVSKHAQCISEEIQKILDPNVLTLGFARRFATYKRPNLLLHDPERLARILNNEQHPVQLIIAGKAHPHDHEGQGMIKKWTDYIVRPDVKSSAVFLVDYDMQVAEHMVQGVDLWINTPTRPWEASGTSGMKVLVNGGLNLSELDGWWAEAYTPEVGWALGDGEEHNDPAWDAIEADALYTLLEEEISPAFYTRNDDGIPEQWVQRMRESMARLTPLFSTNRMLREYTENYYLPTSENFMQRMADHERTGPYLMKWKRRLSTYWADIHFGELQIEEIDGFLRFQVPVYLGEIEADMIRVELFANPLDENKPEPVEMTIGHELTGAINGYLYTQDVPISRPASDYTPRIVPNQPELLIPIETSQILWYR